ncbi:spexin [Sorex araneus]|uniref:spexin n=1 Tax=Sorex araneus TaxID=42254 RepID=UPI002433DE94|nr:spexin [Sorex araneus]
MKGRLAATLTLFLLCSLLGHPGVAPQHPRAPRNWTPQAMLYLKGAQGRRFLSDQSRGKGLSDLPPDRRSPNPQPLTLPEVAALLLASLQKAQEVRKED